MWHRRVKLPKALTPEERAFFLIGVTVALRQEMHLGLGEHWTAEEEVALTVISRWISLDVNNRERDDIKAILKWNLPLDTPQ